MANYTYQLHKTGKSKKKIQKSEIRELILINKTWKPSHKKQVEISSIIAESVNSTRSLVNNPPNIINTETFAKEAEKVAEENHYIIRIIEKDELEEMGMNALLGVNRGSELPAKMIIIEHDAGRKGAPIALVGKGIMFDTGGINLKPSGHIEDMQLDMGGAALVLGIFRLLKKLNIKKRVIGIIPITDNSIDAKSQKPSEIVTTYSGRTVEIGNTDAEGRLILADALNYTVKQYKPKYVIDFATLTGAIMVALAYRNAGLFGNDETLKKSLIKSAENTDEGLVALPITDSDRDSIKGNFADLANLSKRRYAGSATAAAFLENFIEDSKWAHLDIAGAAWTKEPKEYETKYATGYGIRLVIDFLQNLK